MPCTGRYNRTDVRLRAPVRRSCYAEQPVLDRDDIEYFVHKAHGSDTLEQAIAAKVLATNSPFTEMELSEEDTLRLFARSSVNDVVTLLETLARSQRDRPGPAHRWLVERLDLIEAQGVWALAIDDERKAS